MAGTLADMMGMARPTAPRSLADDGREAPDDEADEAPVVAEPRIDRSAVAYSEPRPGIDGAKYWGQCGACRNYLPESSMHGAVVGSRCALLGNFPITDDDACFKFTPWDDGKPKMGVIQHCADASIAGQRAAVSPWQVGYRSNTCIQCHACRFFDVGENECEMLEELTTKLPDVFDMDKAVNPNGRCNLWRAPPESEGM